ncbi:MAG: hypothetical protein AB7K09_06150 [Planctomycetota bacterium]
MPMRVDDVRGGVAVALGLLRPALLRARDESAFVELARSVLRSAAACERQLVVMSDFGDFNGSGVSRRAESELSQLASARVAQHLGPSADVQALDADDLVTLFADCDLLLGVAARLHPSHRAAFERAANPPADGQDDVAAAFSGRTAGRTAGRTVVPLRVALVAAVLLVALTAGITSWLTLRIGGGGAGAVHGSASTDDANGDPNDAATVAIRPATGGDPHNAGRHVHAQLNEGEALIQFNLQADQFLNHPAPGVRIMSASILISEGRADTRVFRTLVRTSHDDPVLAAYATQSLSQVPSDQLVPALLDVVATSPDLADTVLFILMRTSPPMQTSGSMTFDGGDGGSDGGDGNLLDPDGPELGIFVAGAGPPVGLQQIVLTANRVDDDSRRKASRVLVEHITGEPVDWSQRWPADDEALVLAWHRWFTEYMTQQFQAGPGAGQTLIPFPGGDGPRRSSGGGGR